MAEPASKTPAVVDDGAETEEVRGRPDVALVVVVPCLNEERTVGDVVRGIPRELPGVASVRVLVVDDGSTDRTAEVAEEAGASVLRHTFNRGLGNAFRHGIGRALDMGADVVVNLDGDGQFDPADIPKLLEPVLRGAADFATASRFKDPALVPSMPWVKRLGNWGMSRLVGILIRQRFEDVSCGFRAYRREALLHMHLMGTFTYTQETFLELAFKGYRIEEVPLKIRGVREHGKSRMASNLLRYGTRTFMILFRAFRDFRPLLLFATVAGICFVLALGLFAFLGVHYYQTGNFSPHIWAGMTGGFLAGCGLIVFAIGVSADMANRQRIMLERTLSTVRKLEWLLSNERGGRDA